MHQLDCEQGTVTLLDDHFECFPGGGEFTGYGVDQILAGLEKFYCPGLDRVGVRMLGHVLFLHKCLDLMDKFVKNEATWETPIMEYVKRKDLLTRLKTSLWVRQWTYQQVDKL